VIVDFNEFDAFRIACKIEKDGILFYTQLASSIKIPEPKEILEFLLEEEKKHLKIFEEHLGRLRQVKEDVGEDNDLLTSMDFGVFQPYQGLKDLGDIMTNIPKALRLGLMIEDKSIKFYVACSFEVSMKETKEELLNIIAEEKRHKSLLERIIGTLPKA
jgi:rubrerythrin